MRRPERKSADARTGRRLRFAAVTVAVGLAIGFLVAHQMRGAAEDELADAARAKASAPPAVVVVRAERSPTAETLTLPGKTAAWYDSTIYARVSGYVAKWFVDIGDHVKKGQVLATIETPDLDAELAAAQAKLKSAEADVKVREAQAAFAKTTYERWRNSPTGVVSRTGARSEKGGLSAARRRSSPPPWPTSPSTRARSTD